MLATYIIWQCDLAMPKGKIMMAIDKLMVMTDRYALVVRHNVAFTASHNESASAVSACGLLHVSFRTETPAQSASRPLHFPSIMTRAFIW